MSFVSYAQNFEDVMLHRALNHVDHGFYIDVGAWSPDIDSVTRAFYELGWRGINVEPNPEFHGQLCAKRPRDINLKVAVSDHEAVLSMNFLGSSGLSTLDDHIAAKHLASGLAVERKDVQITTLRAIWREHVPLTQEVHFLKVDVEGAEKFVLDGNDWQQCRPWIVVVEATLPMEQTDSYAAWEPILLSAGYHFAYADGLNRYYLASEHVDLMPSFRFPPNVFDGFVMHAQREAEAQAAQAQARANDAEAQVAQARAQAKDAEAQMQQAYARLSKAEARANEAEVTAVASLDMLQSIRASLSWRITGPMRFLADLFFHAAAVARSAFIRSMHYIKKITHAALFILASAVIARPKLKLLLNQCLLRHPALHRKLLRAAHRNGWIAGGPSSTYSIELSQKYFKGRKIEDLSPRARKIYDDLNIFIQKAKNK